MRLPMQQCRPMRSCRAAGGRAPARLSTVSVRAVFGSQPATKAAEPGIYETMAKVNGIKKVMESNPVMRETALEPKRFTSDFGENAGFVLSRDVQKDGTILAIPEDLAVTIIDAEKQELVGAAAAGCSDLIALTLWLVAERAKGAASAYASLISTLPERTNTPLLWSDDELQTLLAGSPVLEESRSRIKELKRQWAELNENFFSKDPSSFPPSLFGYDQFAAAFSVVLAHAIYLPSASLFALLPVASLMGRTGNGNGSFVDYDEETKRVLVKAGRSYREGQEVLLSDERPNGELAMVTGIIPDTNMSDFLTFPAELLQADKYYMMKSQILESMGFSAKEKFPVYADRMPNQLLAYVRLTRIGDPALFAKVSFEQDVVLNQMNEYETLQLLMGDCRERLQAYAVNMEDDIKLNQQRGLSPKERLAVKLRLSEKRIISSTMDAVRQRLAPVRGIPTKSGQMQDPNSDLKEIFDTLEAIPNAPKALIDGFMSWARGEQDPDWKDRGKPQKEKPKRPW